jgi:Tol biopolymer transport system component
MARIFISYSRKDEDFARRLATSLAGWGADIWIDVEDIPVGLKWSRAIQEGLDLSDVLIVVMSPDSMTSSNVEDEWQYFLDQRKPVIPVLLHPAKVHFQLSRIQYVDFNKHEYDLALRQLHTVLVQKGLSIQPLPGSAAHPPAQAALPVREESTPIPPSPSRRTGWIVIGAVVIVAVIAALLINGQPNPQTAADNPTTEVALADTTDTATPTPSRTSSIIIMYTQTATSSPTLSATDIENTVQAEIAAFPTQEAQTLAAIQAATATFWTPTPTFDIRATARARITETFEALAAAATSTFNAAQTQAALDMTATSTLWTPTPSTTPTFTFTPTPLGGGGQIAFSTRAGGSNEDIYLLDLATGATQQLTNDPANDWYPAWSPDGSRIAFSSNRQNGNRDLYVMDADGENVTRLTFNADFEEDPVWSPDGTQIAFSSSFGVEGKRDIYIIKADGTDMRQLIVNPAEDREPSWSPDGTRIAFHSDRKDADFFQIYTFDAQCADPEACERSVRAIENAYGTFPGWSPDGEQIVFQSNVDRNFNIYVINLDSTGFRRLTDDLADDRRPSWSPDGRYVVFQSVRDGDLELYRLHVATGETVQLTDNTWDDIDPVWRP